MPRVRAHQALAQCKEDLDKLEEHWEEMDWLEGMYAFGLKVLEFLNTAIETGP